MLAKETIIEQTKIIVLQKKPNLNIEKFMKLDFSLLCWQTVVIKHTIHQFKDGQYIGSSFTLVERKVKLQKYRLKINKQFKNLNFLQINHFILVLNS